MSNETGWLTEEESEQVDAIVKETNEKLKKAKSGRERIEILAEFNNQMEQFGAEALEAKRERERLDNLLAQKHVTVILQELNKKPAL